MSNRVLVIGLDGADWRILKPYLDQGLMPNLAHMLESGVSGPLRSTIPTNSCTAWSTFMTGRNPGKHAVYNFTQRSPQDATRLVGVNSQSRRAESFFEVLGRYDRKIGAINVPVTFPPFPVNGFMLGGMIVQEGKPYTFPEALATELDEQVGGYPVNCMRWRFMLGQLEELLDEVIMMTQQRARVLEYLIDQKEWDVLVQVFVGPDRLQHALMHVLDPEHPYYNDELTRQLAPKLQTAFQVMDDILGRSREQLGEEATIMIVSDHGFRSIHKAIHIREILAKHGLLQLASKPFSVRRLARKWLPKQTRKALSQKLHTGGGSNGVQVGSVGEMGNLDWSRTRAFVTAHTSQGVYINLAGREPHGIVAQGTAYEQALEEVEAALLAERDPETGQPVIESVIRAKDHFSGPWVDQAPDLLFVPKAGYTHLKAAKTHLGACEWHVGDHDLDGIFAISGPGIRQGTHITGTTLMDIAPNILYLAGVPIPQDMDGRVLDIFTDRRLETDPPDYEQEMTSYGKSDYVYTSEEERQVEEQLRSLGYL